MTTEQHTEKRKLSKPFDPIQAVKDNIWMILIISALGSVAVITLTHFSSKPYYTTSATIRFDPHLPELLYNDAERYLHSFEDWMRTQIHEIEAHDVLEKAIADYEKAGFHWMLPEETIKTAVDRLRGRLQVSQINNTQIMSLSLSGPHQKGLAEIINTVIDSYISIKNQQRIAMDKQKLTYLLKERDVYAARLEESYQGLMDISKKYATAVADEKNLYIYLNMFMDMRAKYNGVLLTRIETENKLAALQDKRERLLNLSVSGFEANEMLLEMEQMIREKMIGIKEESPEYQRMEKLLENIRQKNVELTRKMLLSQIEMEIFEFTEQYQTAFNSEKQLMGELRKTQIEVMEFNTAVLRASTKRQEIERFINTWNRINQRIEEIQIELFNPGRVNVISHALMPEAPDASQKTKKMALGIFACVFLGLVVAVGRSFLDNRIRRPGDIEKVLGFPVTGHILDVKAEQIEANNIYRLVKDHPHSFISSLYHKLANRFEKERFTHQTNVFGLFGLKHGCGATTTAFNILSILDAPESRKLYIDLNVRTPLDLKHPIRPEAEGFLNWAEKGGHWQNYIIQDDAHPFQILKLGKSENESGQLRTSSLRELIAEIREDYDYIFIDAPPVLQSHEAQNIAQVVDVVVTVIDAEQNTWPELISSTELMNKLGVSVLSVVLNKTPLLRNGFYKRAIKDFYALPEGTLSNG